MPQSTAPLVAHVIYRLAIGGLENGLVNLINRIPEGRYRHAVICIADYSDFADRIQRKDVAVFALNKLPGVDLKLYFELFQLFRRLRPAIVHGRNLAALDGVIPAMLAGIRCRIHGEHGRDVSDPRGENRKLQWLRRIYAPLITHYVPLSQDLEIYLKTKIKIPQKKITQIYNGVDAQRFAPAEHGRERLPFAGFGPGGRQVIIGTVGRLDPVKGQLGLVEAFARVIEGSGRLRAVARLVVIGDGPMSGEIESRVRASNIVDLTWLAGARADIPQLLRCMDVFVLPSLAEGISNTILEAMASGLPVIATDVGGNGELVIDGETGRLVPAGNQAAMADAIQAYIADPITRAEHGAGGRRRVEQRFSLERMVQRYMDLYDGALGIERAAGSEWAAAD